MTDPKDRIEHTLEVLVYAPIGVGLYLRDMGPTFVNMFVARGRAEIDRRQAQVHQRTTTAKSVGQVAMTFGMPMVKQRVEREVVSARQKAQTFLGAIPSAIPGIDSNGTTDTKPAKPPTRPAPPTVRRETARSDTARSETTRSDANAGEINGSAAKTPRPAANGASAAGDALPIPGYDALSASQVVERLTGLTPDELTAVRSYEGAHRNRRTILGKIDQISA